MRRAITGSAVLQIFLLLFPLHTRAQYQPVHGLWVWKTPSVLAAPHAAATLRDFCRSKQVNEVNVSFSATDKGGPTEQNQLADLEPQQRPENKGPGNLNFLPGLVDAYSAARHLTEPARLTLNADIQKKLLEGNLDQRRSLLLSLPRITLMLYELSSPNDGESLEQKEAKRSSNSKKYMKMAYQGLGDPKLAKMAIGLRRPDYDQLMPRMLRSVDDTLRGNPHYLGWAWHSYNDQ